MPRTKPPYAPEFRQQMVELVRAGLEPGDVKGLTSCVVQLAGSSSLRRKLAAAAREHVTAHFSVETAVTRICDVYREAIASTRV